MKKFLIVLLLLFLTACGPKIKLVPQVYMPVPPEMLMRSPKDLNTIKPDLTKKEATPNSNKGS